MKVPFSNEQLGCVVKRFGSFSFYPDFYYYRLNTLLPSTPIKYSEFKKEYLKKVPKYKKIIKL